MPQHDQDGQAPGLVEREDGAGAQQTLYRRRNTFCNTLAVFLLVLLTLLTLVLAGLVCFFIGQEKMYEAKQELSEQETESMEQARTGLIASGVPYVALQLVGFVAQVSFLWYRFGGDSRERSLFSSFFIYFCSTTVLVGIAMYLLVPEPRVAWISVVTCVASTTSFIIQALFKYASSTDRPERWTEDGVWEMWVPAGSSPASNPQPESGGQSNGAPSEGREIARTGNRVGS